MPRRTLALITGVVVAAHWLVLSGVSLGWTSAAPASVRAFSTRSIAAQPHAAPPVPVAAAPSTGPTAAPRKPPAVQRPRAPSGLSAAPASDSPLPQHDPVSDPSSDDPLAVAEPAQGLAADETLPATADSTAPVERVATAAQATASDASAASAASAESAAPSVLAPHMPAGSTSPLADTAAGVDISPPGGGSGSTSSTSAPPVRLPPSARLAYDVTGRAKKFEYHARAQLVWQHDGARYEARQEVSAFLVGSRAQSSVGQITAQGLQPERFSDRARSEQAAHFDSAKGRVVFSANTPEAAIGPGAQDRLSVFIQLGALLAADPARYVPGTHVTLTTISARSADRWTFTVEGPDTLDLPGGPTPALKLQRLPRKDYDQKAELWVAPSLGYLPARIRITQANGDYADLMLRSSSAP